MSARTRRVNRATLLTTVGFGDIVPVTTAGRWITMATLIVGIVLILGGTVSTYALPSAVSTRPE